MYNVYKFVTHDIPKISDLHTSMVYKVMDKLNNGVKFKDIDSTLLSTLFSELWHSDAYKTGKYKLQGYIFDFSPYLKTYLVKNKYYGWSEIKAFNKTWLRKNAVNPSYILKIVEL